MDTKTYSCYNDDISMTILFCFLVWADDSIDTFSPIFSRALYLAAGNDPPINHKTLIGDKKCLWKNVVERRRSHCHDGHFRMSQDSDTGRVPAKDRLYELLDSLEDLIEDDGSVSMDNRGSMVELATVVKNFQQQYSNLVHGNVVKRLDCFGLPVGEFSVMANGGFCLNAASFCFGDTSRSQK
jgi:hypothetical protein